jgi:hypothetical protein
MADKYTKLFFLLIQLFLFLNTPSTKAQSAFTFGERYAVILGGVGGQEEFTEKYFAQTNRMYDLLVDTLSYKRENIYYLFEHPGFDSLKIQYKATAVQVRKVFNQLAQKMNSQDQLFIFMVGHGTFDGDWSKFNLVGPDLRDIDFAQLLSGLPTKKIILVNTASASGPFIKKLSGEERVIITATKSGAEYHETTFADFFLDALATEEADFNKDRRISMLEAFKYARNQQDTWYKDKRRLRAEHPLLDDNADGQGSQEVDNGSDGLWASRVFLGPISVELESVLKKPKSEPYSPLDSLKLEKLRLQQEIEDLKARKRQMESNKYVGELERLLLRLARVTKQLKQLEAKKPRSH